MARITLEINGPATCDRCLQQVPAQLVWSSLSFGWELRFECCGLSYVTWLVNETGEVEVRVESGTVENNLRGLR